jgi:hypothetical protein
MRSQNQTTQCDLVTLQRTYEDSENIFFINQRGEISKGMAALFSVKRVFSKDTEEKNCRAQINQNRFQWMHRLHLNCSRTNLARHVYRTWCLRGRSKNVPEPLPLNSLLREKLADWDVQMAGVSSGAYVAVLFCCLLGTRRVFSFSGQFNLRPMLEDPQRRELNPWVVRTSGVPWQQIFGNLLHYIMAMSSEIFYVAPQNSSCDDPQLQLAEAEPRILKLSHDSNKHDVNLLRHAPRILSQKSSSHLTNLLKCILSSGDHRIESSGRIAGNRCHFSCLLRRKHDLLYRQTSWRPPG